MQINPTSNATVTGNIDRAAASAMGFQVETTEDMAVLMDILSSLYSDPRTAILREYAVNGRDAHLVAGVTEPVQITLPSEFDSTLRIRDFGTGLTAAEMDDIYGVYLKSTKRGTTETGGFGIGAKSAFAESRQFIVTSIKDGIKNVVLFALDDNNIGTKNVIVAGVATDEPSGVQVEIPFREHKGFAQTARRVFEAWPSGTALIDGTLNVSILDRCTAIDDSAFVLPDEWERRRDVSVIMGGVAYPLPAESAKRVRQAINADSSWSAVYLVAQVNDLSPAPTREALKDTDGNRAWVEAQIESLPGRVEAMHARTADTLPSARAAVAAAYENKMFRIGPSVIWRGETYPTGFTAPAKSVVLWLDKNRDKPVSLCDPQRLIVPRMARVKFGVVVAASISGVRAHATRVMLDQGWEMLVTVPEESGQIGWLRWGHDGDEVDVLTAAQFKALGESIKASTQQKVTVGGAVIEPTYRVRVPRSVVDLELTETALVAVCKEYGGHLRVISRNDGVNQQAVTSTCPVLVQKDGRAPAKKWAKAGLTITRADNYWSEIRQVVAGLNTVERDALALVNHLAPLTEYADRLFDPRLRAAASVPDQDWLAVLATFSPNSREDSIAEVYPVLRARHLDGDDLLDVLNGVYLLRQHQAAQAAVAA